MIKKLCLLLSLIMALSLLGACSSSKPEENPSSSNSSISSEEPSSEPEDTAETPSDEPSEDWGEEDDEYGDFFEDDYFDEEYKYINKLYVYNDEKPITERYGGMSGTVYHAFGFMKDDNTGRVYTDKMMDIELDRLQNTGMHYCRTRYHSEWAWDPVKENYNWNSKRFGYFCDYANALQDRNMEIILSVGWHFGFVTEITQHSIDEVPYLRGDGDDKFGESTGYDLSGLSAEDARMTKSARRFGYFYAETLKALRARGINNVSHLLYMTEPSNGYSGPEMGCENREYVLFSRAFKQKLVEMDNIAATVKHMGPNETSKTGDHLFKYVMDNAPEIFDVYTVHDYPHLTDTTNDVLYELYGTTLDSFVAHAKNGGVWGTEKEFWLDEYDINYDGKAGGQNNSWAGLQNVYGNLIAQQKGVETTVFWQLFDQLWTDHSNTGGEFFEGIHMCGDLPSLFITSIPYDQYYATGLFAKYNGYKNGKSYRTSLQDDSLMYEGVYIGAVQLEDGNWTITIVNLNLEDAYIDVSFGKAINQTLYRHVFDSGKNVPTPDARLADADKCFKNVKNKIYDTIPGGSVTIYTGVKG
ncbi:MAG: hypothetical protein J6C29_05380 [Clostridia bacterium]|nr:hypothetical protein [Clostridia bacterium]